MLHFMSNDRFTIDTTSRCTQTITLCDANDGYLSSRRPAKPVNGRRSPAFDGIPSRFFVVLFCSVAEPFTVSSVNRLHRFASDPVSATLSVLRYANCRATVQHVRSRSIDRSTSRAFCASTTGIQRIRGSESKSQRYRGTK